MSQYHTRMIPIDNIIMIPFAEGRENEQTKRALIWKDWELAEYWQKKN